jgi:hypothetical protein
LISTCGIGVPGLAEHDISTATRIVAQMWHEPYVKPIEENPEFDVIIGGRVYDPSPHTASYVYKGFKNMGIFNIPYPLPLIPFPCKITF